ncbi:MAG: 2-amino-4-hydroxy-6-hydroxymethyldihydropteridine diphosphokinase [Lachnospiraceae bacterium]|nr:2-amino-4-hydroxy-6-hydroxymethyldihydropteridine diphosphokinase [Lachnospiraceae bacterium]
MNLSKVDQIFINEVPFYANHGVFAEEKSLGQTFLLSLVLYVPMERAAAKDDLKKTIHYGEATQKAVAFLQTNTYGLLETAAHRLAIYLLDEFPLLKGVTVKLAKPGAPVRFSFQSLGVCVTRSRHIAYLSLGSNLGDRKAMLDAGLDRLKQNPEIRVKKVSEYINTPAWGYTEQPDFLNAAVEISTTLSPEMLLAACQDAEQSQNRTRQIHWGPRTLDVDILLYDDEVISTPELVIPHPRMTERAFVLQPMTMIAPGACHPVLHLNMEQLFERLNRKEDDR